MATRIVIVLEPAAECGYTVTSPDIPGLVTEGENVADALAHAADAWRAIEAARSSEVKLKPCPFCGSGDVCVSSPEEETFHVYCNGCYAEGPLWQEIGEAIAAWNKRPDAGG